MSKYSRFWELWKSINNTKENLLEKDPTYERDYVPYSMNRQLAKFKDTIFLADEMNRRHHLPKKAQYEFLINTVRRRSRYVGRVDKNIRHEEKLSIVQAYYSYSKIKAEVALKILDDEAIDYISDQLKQRGLDQCIRTRER